jgi:low affinity Fe/Cu permease
MASHASRGAGHPMTFVAAVLIVVIWGCLGPVFGFSDTWQLVINTGTTIVTFLMVFLIQNTQNRDAEAIHIKLDELIRSHRGANNALLDIEELEEKDLHAMRKQYEDLAAKAIQVLRKRHEAGQPPSAHVAKDDNESAPSS